MLGDGERVLELMSKTGKQAASSVANQSDGALRDSFGAIGASLQNTLVHTGGCVVPSRRVIFNTVPEQVGVVRGAANNRTARHHRREQVANKSTNVVERHLVQAAHARVETPRINDHGGTADQGVGEERHQFLGSTRARCEEQDSNVVGGVWLRLRPEVRIVAKVARGVADLQLHLG